MKLLLVDDDHAIRLFLSDAFTLEGWDVRDAPSGMEALRLLESFPADLIVLDQMMPEMTGIETAKIIRGRGFTGPIILFSAYLGPEVREEANALALKPVSKVDTNAVFRIVGVYAKQLSG